MNSGDAFFQLILFIVIIGIFFITYRMVTNALSIKKETSNSVSIEEKLDRIIELLEKDKKS